MNKKRNTPILIALSILFLTTWCATNAPAVGPSLSEIPTLVITNVPDTSNEGRAITPDGQYVVGLSSGSSLGGGSQNGQRGFLYPVGAASAINIISSDNAQASVANGVGYRTALDPVYATNRTEIIISGMSSGYVTEWMTADGGTTFPPKRRNTSFTSNVQPAYNGLGAAVGSDAYYVTSWINGNGQSVYLNQGIGPWLPTYTYSAKGITSTDSSRMNGVSASGRTVGWRINGGIRKNYMLTWNGTGTPTPVFFNGLDGTEAGQGISVSADGNTIFGQSPIVVGGTTFYGYKVVNPGASQTINPLPLLGDEAGSTSLQFPYACTPDGRYGVGMAYRGTEKATVWNTTDADPAKWTALDLTDLALANGIAGAFTRMDRPYSAGTNEAGDLVITGRGYAGATRAFVMTVPEWIAQIGFPGNQAVNAGANVSIVMKTNGTDALSFQWYKNGSLLSGATSTSLAYNNVTCASGDAGTYSVVVNNNGISQVVTGAMVLTVLDPAITQQPLNQTNRGYTTASFTVTAVGSPTLTYQWKRGGTELSDGPTGWGSTIAGASSSALSIANLQAADEGSYSVVVTTSAGGCTATSLTRYLAVLPAQPRFTSIVADPGGSYTLTFNGWLNETWYLYYSTNVTAPLQTPDWTWTGQYGVFDGVNPVVWQDVTPGEGQRFYLLSNPELPGAP